MSHAETIVSHATDRQLRALVARLPDAPIDDDYGTIDAVECNDGSLILCVRGDYIPCDSCDDATAIVREHLREVM